MKALSIILLTLALASCSTLDKMQDKGSSEIAKLILTYCLTTDTYYRQELRAQVNEKLNGAASIKIECQ